MRRSAAPVPTVRNCGSVGVILREPRCVRALRGAAVQRQPTILQVIPRLDTGGAELSTIEITEAIVRAGGRALVATEGGRLARSDHGSRRRDHRVSGGTQEPRSASSPMRRRWQASSRASRRRLIHARSRAPAWSALLAARRTGIPFVTTYHGAYAEEGRLKRLYNSVMARADRVIANSGYTAGLIRRATARRRRAYASSIAASTWSSSEPDARPPDRVTALRRQWRHHGDSRSSCRRRG